MRPFVACSDKDRVKFWKEVDGYSAPIGPLPVKVEQGLRKSLPLGATVERFAARRKGGGSLGRPRYVAVAHWRGGRIVREAKAYVPSAWDWAHGAPGMPSRFLDLWTALYRSPDPFLAAHDGFIFRRIAADSRKVEIASDAGLGLHRKLLTAMGFELGAMHGSANRAAAVRDAFDQLRSGWLEQASKDAALWVESDFREWIKRSKP